MNAIRHEPPFFRRGFVNLLQRDLDRLLGSSAALADDSPGVTSDWLPAVDIKEEAGSFVIHADVPGVDPKDIDVTLEKGVLTVRGQRKSDSREERDGYRRVERVSGQFYRRFSLPDTAAQDGVEAKYANGVLEVRIPKQPQVQPRRITVAAA
ncbi:MAG TPA: Hsp20/alpha crystallin family protein [Steroidobacteraceae bacterium]|nr:Hsp20/alpha crystallin family protein [Steroidobacteraceae bacterium]